VIASFLKIESWRDCTVVARQFYHRALVPMLCVGLLVLIAAKILPGLHALVLSQL